MSLPRRRFLSWLGSASLLGATGTPSIATAAPRSHGHSEDDHALPIAETWDMSWTARVSGKYTAVFDSPESAGGAALFRAAARARAKEMLIPGVILQPNGIFAALRAQEAGCAYVMAS